MGKIHEIQLGGVCVEMHSVRRTHIFSNDMLNKLCLFDQSISVQGGFVNKV